MSTLTVYLTYEGNCEEAFHFYKSAFRTEIESLMRYKDAPPEHPLNEQEAAMIINISMSVGKGHVLMGCDRLPSFGPGKKGDNYAISIGPDSKEEADRLFNELSAGGTVGMAMHDAFWGAYFGMFTDKFGVHWMINHMTNPQ